MVRRVQIGKSSTSNLTRAQSCTYDGSHMTPTLCCYLFKFLALIKFNAIGNGIQQSCLVSTASPYMLKKTTKNVKKAVFPFSIIKIIKTQCVYGFFFFFFSKNKKKGGDGGLK